ncbi:unnamed protein product [Chilo suppressalis]|uniref:CXC domain-containing protein n=1 Tax=Chilo suppressalis TaxID=168631 RepID=A0ABN8B5Y3_CHISP|nr:unnamed protein product [Chilo suppressalis]
MFNSNETEDGLAKVTDPRTGNNREVKIQGTIYVPIIDYNLERIGMTTRKTTAKPQMPAEEQAAYRVLTHNVDLNKMGERDWLAIEVAMGGRDDPDTCQKEGCQSRCSKMACDSMCSGDTCASGCLGNSCTAFCKGPGCMAMCIGEECNAVCQGVACDTRCRGKGCEAKCNKLSCSATINGAIQKYTGGTFEDQYPGL